MYTLLVGFLLGIIFSSVCLIYIFFQLLSKKVDPNDIPVRKQQISKSIITTTTTTTTTLQLKDITTDKLQEILDISDIRPTSIETCKWINFIASRILLDINNSTQFSQKVYSILNNIFDENSKPDFLGKLNFSDISFGTTTPEIGIVKLVSPPNSTYSILEFDIMYQGDASVTASAELWLNWPQKHIACLPVKTKLSLKQFSGKIVLYIPNTPNPTCVMYFKNAPQISLRMITKMGHETVLKEPGKIGTFLQSQILKHINQKLVPPNFITFNLFQFLYNTPTLASTSTTSTNTTTTTQPIHTINNNVIINNGTSNISTTSQQPISPIISTTSPVSSPILSPVSSPTLQSSLKSNNTSSSTKKRTSNKVSYAVPISPNTNNK